MSVVPGGLSIVMPVYNKAPHVDRSIRSILAQTAGFDELIVVDDGSTDGSLEKVQLHSDHRMHIYTRSSPGPGGYAARNLGIRRATSEWIAFLDADELVAPEFHEGNSRLNRTG